MDNRNFYTYAYLRKDGTPYYIGKGCGRRSRKKHNVFVPPSERILILKKNLTEEEAFKHEVYMISVLGRRDLGTGILRNLTNGGEGCSGRQWREDQRKQISDSLLGHPVSEKSRQLMSENSWMKGEIPESYRDKQREIALRKGYTPPSKSGTTWWTDGEVTVMQESSPGPEWTKGRGDLHTPEFKKKLRDRNNKEGLPPSFNKKGMKWWTNGSKSTMALECPGPEWREGRK